MINKTLKWCLQLSVIILLFIMVVIYPFFILVTLGEKPFDFIIGLIFGIALVLFGIIGGYAWRDTEIKDRISKYEKRKK